jgi:hypothetical protein
LDDSLVPRITSRAPVSSRLAGTLILAGLLTACRDPASTPPAS